MFLTLNWFITNRKHDILFIKKWPSDKMNKCSLFLVFLCGIFSATLMSFLKEAIESNINPLLSNFYKSDIGILPPNTDLALMDDGYLAMAQLNLHHFVERGLERKVEKTIHKPRKSELEERNSEIEALNTLKAAAKLIDSGKSVHAGRLLEHAHSLAPAHHDVLLMYGEYLEEHAQDVVQADHMFLKALTVSPSSSHALKNRQRTLSLVEKIDASMMSRIDNKRDELAQIPTLSGALRRVKREAYFQHIYHTAAIEGNTLTLPQIRMILETGLSVGGKSIVEHNEILGVDSALKYINTTLVHRIGKISLRDILEIHRRVLGHVDPIEAGTLRITQVFVSDHVPPPPSKVEILMQEFVSWLNSESAQRMHPIKYSALAHYKLVFIHPFVDGNGRTARLLMNFLLMQAGYPPVIVRKQDRSRYYEHLQTATDGDTRPFVRFVARCLEKTLDVYLWATRDHLPEIEESYVDEQSKLRAAQPFTDSEEVAVAPSDYTGFSLPDALPVDNVKKNVPRQPMYTSQLFETEEHDLALLVDDATYTRNFFANLDENNAKERSAAEGSSRSL